ncbi:MAG: hypothetical protein ACRDLK_02760, partial [Gaiellaceae bacterium]
MLAITIGYVTPSTGTPERYATELGELWAGLAGTLGRIEAIAREPDLLDEDASIVALRRLQYRLHAACEEAYGLQPPAGGEGVHAELSGALAAARDATAEVAEAAELGGAVGVEPLLHEWRGAIFGVRLARKRLAAHRAPQSGSRL